MDVTLPVTKPRCWDRPFAVRGGDICLNEPPQRLLAYASLDFPAQRLDSS